MKLHFEYWTDPMCIWALIAQPRLERLLAYFGDCVAVTHRVVPVFGSFPERFAPGGKWHAAGIEGRVATTARVAQERGVAGVSGVGWRLPLSSSWAPSVAIKAVADLERTEGCAAGTCGLYTRRLREAFFVEDRNITQRAEQLAVAEALELPRAALERRLDDGSAMALLVEDADQRERKRIQGSPTYVFDGGRAMLFGDFDEDVLRATVQALLRAGEPGGSPCA